MIGRWKLEIGKATYRAADGQVLATILFDGAHHWKLDGDNRPVSLKWPNVETAMRSVENLMRARGALSRHSTSV